MKKRVVRTKQQTLKNRLKELAIGLSFDKSVKSKNQLEKPLEKIVKADIPKAVKEQKEKQEYIDSVHYTPNKKETKRTYEGINNMDMVVDLVYRDYFRIFYSLYWVEYEVSRQLNIWRQSNRVMARCYGLKA